VPKTPTRRKNLLVLTSTFPRWKDDAEPPFVFDLCRHLSDDFNIQVLAPHAPGAAFSEEMDGVQVQRFRYFSTRRQSLAYRGGILSSLKAKRSRYVLVPFFLLAQLLATVRLLHTRRFHCIHAHWLIPQGVTAAIAARTAAPEPPILTTSHGGDLYGLGGHAFRALKRAVVSRSAAVTVVSRSMAADLRRLPAAPANIHVIPMGVDLQQRFTPGRRDKGDAKLLFAGRLVEKKGVRYLIDALPKIAEAHPRLSLVIVGDGQEKSRLQERVSKTGLEDRVEFVGAVANESLVEFYQQADIVVFPSVTASGGDREGFGLVLVEALGCECATVVTDLPAMADIVTDGKTGLVVPQKNPERLAESVIRLLSDAQLRVGLARAGRRHVVERFDWRVVAGQYRRLLHSIIGD
jgi:glycosyltransferase involved in cell wall biosynthesis